MKLVQWCNDDSSLHAVVDEVLGDLSTWLVFSGHDFMVDDGNAILLLGYYISAG